MIRLVAHYEVKTDSFGRRWRREWHSPRKRGDSLLKRFERWRKRAKFEMIAGPVNQATNSIGSGASTNTTITTPTAGNFLVLTSGAASLGNTINSVTGGGVTWSNPARAVNNAGVAEIWYGMNSTGLSSTVTTTAAGAPYIINISEWSGVHKTNALITFANGNTGTGSTTISSPTISAGASLLIAALGLNATGGLVSGPTSGFTELTDADQTVALAAYSVVSDPTANRSTTWTIGVAPGTGGGVVIAAFRAQPVIEQSAYRFRNDDGSEVTATAAAAENTQLSAGKNTNRRVRLQLNTTSTYPSSQFQVEYRKQGTSGPWHKVNE